MKIVPGLEGVFVANTRLSRVEGEEGRLTLAGYAVDAIAPAVEFEAMVHLLWHDRLPDPDELASLRADMAAARELDPATLALLRRAAERGVAPIEALRMGLASLGLGEVSRERALACVPVLVACYSRLRAGLEPIAPDRSPGQGVAAEFLRASTGEAPSPAQVRALSTYLNAVSDHGFNASTFTARIIASTQAPLLAAIEGALAALTGPLHGGAPGPALEALLALRERGGDLDAETRRWAAAKIDAGERIMGFGHRVYRTRDPRADVLGAAASELLAGGQLYEDARVHERAVLEVLAARKPGRTLATNVEFYTALLLHGLGFDADIFTCVFAIGRVAGWTAHYAEQAREGRLIRPRAGYCGALDRRL
ncbi:citrate synthase/methylcitrate synthase [Pseudenhygromyxa sp. WMMC2535]|uniref:citrate/2-methylcitrate synthase n=1 Tax=Pseudenhygromyxa sp. WMMC2535 TaxID=2712867 RepID=UPI0015516766|nr:citrate/2-methylcitrate synthase [Pseudenhygromyxa sp. WMMC2535]NVB37392.1 citrate synthase/methylcitrate synthase [Pseudenhygromyxa sp. WMMC2535]